MAFVSNSPDTVPERRTGFTFRGNEIVLSKTRGHPMTGIEKRKGYYPDDKRIEVVTLWACLGNPDRCSELSKVPPGTIRDWSRQEWFKDLLEEIRNENNEKLDAKFTEIAEKTQDCILDRLENGDFVLSRDGELHRKPINAKDLAIVGAVTIDKRQIIRNKPTSITQTNTSGELSEDKLHKLAQTFLSLVNKKELNPDVVTVEAEYVEVVEDSGKG